jgi:hypothetical protein
VIRGENIAMSLDKIVLSAGIAAVAALFAYPAASGATARPGGAASATYRPMQGFSYALGSKQAVGYFTSAEDRCELTVMIAEAVDLENSVPTSAARVRLALLPGQKARFDSEERATMEIACGADAATLLVEASMTAD